MKMRIFTPRAAGGKFTVRSYTLVNGGAISVLSEMEPGSVSCCVTSPPYWWMRDYGLQPTIFGGDNGCDHEWVEKEYQRKSSDTKKGKKQETNIGANQRDVPIKYAECSCGAWSGQLGLEQTIDLYISHLVEVFSHVRRVLKDDGTLWLNIGDTYFDSNKKKYNDSLKPKDMCMIPARVAMALQEDGWWLRSEIVWHKSNAMTESVKDRPTRAHEMVYLLSKSKKYYYDASDRSVSHDRHMRSVWGIVNKPYSGRHYATMPVELAERCIIAGCPEGGMVLDPFMGSGTTIVAAENLGRRSVGIELSEEYYLMAGERLENEYMEES